MLGIAGAGLGLSAGGLAASPLGDARAFESMGAAISGNGRPKPQVSCGWSTLREVVVGYRLLRLSNPFQERTLGDVGGFSPDFRFFQSLIRCLEQGTRRSDFASSLKNLRFHSLSLSAQVLVTTILFKPLPFQVDEFGDILSLVNNVANTSVFTHNGGINRRPIALLEAFTFLFGFPYIVF